MFSPCSLFWQFCGNLQLFSLSSIDTYQFQNILAQFSCNMGTPFFVRSMLVKHQPRLTTHVHLHLAHVNIIICCLEIKMIHHILIAGVKAHVPSKQLLCFFLEILTAVIPGQATVTFLLACSVASCIIIPTVILF